MTGEGAYQHILNVARAQFAAQGYRNVTIRAIAVEAGYSPAMVMKLMGSKERLFALASPLSQEEGSQRDMPPRAELGHELVRRVLDRDTRGERDPWAMAPLIIESAPDREGVRDEVATRYVSNMAAMIGDTTSDSRHARAVVMMLLGLGAAVQGLRIFDKLETDDTVALVGPALQQHIDLCHGPRIPIVEYGGGRVISAGMDAVPS